MFKFTDLKWNLSNTIPNLEIGTCYYKGQFISVYKWTDDDKYDVYIGGKGLSTTMDVGRDLTVFGVERYINAVVQ